MKPFKVGTIRGGGPLFCDTASLVDTRLLVEANSGGGKSWAVRLLLEQTHGQVQHLVIDPEGEFASLREKFDYVLASPVGGDTAAHPRSAALLAERLLELRVSAILDIYELKQPARVAFVRRFVEALVDAPKRLWHPVLVVIDESHVYCPQHGNAESAQAVIDLATRGRKRGFCAVLATQRLAKLHKDAAAECNNKLIGRTNLDIDIQRAADELGMPKTLWHKLREREPGEFFATGPAFDQRGVADVKIGMVKTTHPKAGARIGFRPPPPTARVRAMLPKLADLPAEAEERQRTTEELRAEIAQLKREVARKPVAAPKAVEVQVLKAADRKAIAVLGRGLARIETQQKALVAKYDSLNADALGRLLADWPKRWPEKAAPVASETLLRAAGPSGALTRASSRQSQPETRVTVPVRAVSTPHMSSTELLPPGERACLVGAGQYGERGISREGLSVLTGYKRSSRDAYIARLVAKGFVEVRDGKVYATSHGLGMLGGSFEPLPTGASLRTYWLERLPPGERAILEQLIDRYPSPVERDKIDTEYKRSSRDAYIARLVAKQIVVVERGLVAASSLLFDE